MSPKSIFHRAARLIIFTYESYHVTSVLKTLQGSHLNKKKSQSLTGSKRYHVICHTLSTCDLCLQLRSDPPHLFHSKHSGSHSSLSMPSVCLSPDLCTCYSMCLEVLSPCPRMGLSPLFSQTLFKCCSIKSPLLTSKKDTSSVPSPPIFFFLDLPPPVMYLYNV